MRRKLAVCIGINDYPDAPLRGCVNDALDWSTLFRRNGYEVVDLMTDGRATKAGMLGAMQAVIGQARRGDRVTITYSGHGTWVPDRDGDEIDRRDEALVPYDYLRAGVITDDELNEVFSTRRYGVRLTMISDSCHSGTLQRLLGGAPAPKATARFLSPVDIGLMTEARALEAEQRVVRSSSRATSILLSGCADAEVSYDAFIDGRFRGAMTAAALASYARPGMSWAAWHKEIRKRLPSADYPQTPQLQATRYQRYGAAL